MDENGSGTPEKTYQDFLTRDPQREDSVPAYESVAEQDFTNESGWKAVADKVWEYEQSTIAGWNRQIDTLLVFAGLFSAVVTAFNVQYYATLQPSSGDQVMLRLPSDLANPIYVTKLSTTSDSSVAATAVAINTLWFLALVLSLGAASLGISVKQWLSSYIPPETIASRQRTRLWHHRQRGLRKWHVPAIVSVLPILLQLALVLFLVGLVVLLWTLNMVAAIVIMVPVAVMMVLLGITSLIPTFAPDCPYKSPQAWWIYLVLHRLTRFDGTLTRRLFETRRHFLMRLWRTVVIVRDWVDRDNNLLRARFRERKAGSAVDTVGMLVAADHLVRDDAFLKDVIVPAFDLMDSTKSDFDACLEVFYELVQSRAHTAYLNMSSTSDSAALPMMFWYRDEMDSDSVEAMADLTLRILTKVVVELWPNREKQAREMSRVLTILQALLAALPNSQARVLMQLINWYCEEQMTYRPLNAREEDPVEVISQHAVRYRSKIKALPVRQQAVLGTRAMARLEQLLEDASSDSFRHRQAERGLLRLIGVVLDNRQPGVPFESDDVVARLCRLLGGTVPISKSTRTTLIYLVTRVSSDACLSTQCVLELVACLRKLVKEPYNDIGAQNTLCLCTAIEVSLNQLQPEDVAQVSQPLLSTLHDVLDLTSHVDRYGSFDYLRGILTLFEAVSLKQPHLLSHSDVETLAARVAVCTEGWPREMVEAKALQAKLTILHQQLDKNTCVFQLQLLTCSLELLASRPPVRTSEDDEVVSISIGEVQS